MLNLFFKHWLFKFCVYLFDWLFILLSCRKLSMLHTVFVSIHHSYYQNKGACRYQVWYQVQSAKGGWIVGVETSNCKEQTQQVKCRHRPMQSHKQCICRVQSGLQSEKSQTKHGTIHYYKNGSHPKSNWVKRVVPCRHVWIVGVKWRVCHSEQDPVDANQNWNNKLNRRFADWGRATVSNTTRNSKVFKTYKPVWKRI